MLVVERADGIEMSRHAFGEQQQSPYKVAAALSKECSAVARAIVNTIFETMLNVVSVVSE
jgi:hypothetical protein